MKAVSCPCYLDIKHPLRDLIEFKEIIHKITCLLHKMTNFSNSASIQGPK